jgi:serine protease Do
MKLAARGLCLTGTTPLSGSRRGGANLLRCHKMMVPSFTRARIAVIAIAAFVGGLVLASSLDWTRSIFAQSQGPTTAQVRTLSEASDAFVSIAESVTPAVVSIRVENAPTAQQRGQTQRTPAIPPNVPEEFREFFRQMPESQPRQEPGGSGSGFLVSKDGYILTNNHVVTRRDQQTPVDRITVRMINGREYQARIIGRDATTDVAVLKIDGNDFPTVPLGDDNRERIGEWVLAVGNPLGLDFTVTAGIISAKNRNINPGNNQYAVSDLIQTDAAINPGNSGGPLVNRRGEVIGINNALMSSTGYFAGYGFAIPISLAKKVMDDLIRHGRVRIPVIGVQIGPVTSDDAAAARLPEVRGALVQGFSGDDSPARRAGLQPGDVIVKADGQDVDRVSTLQRAIRQRTPGETIKVEIVRFGQRRTFDVRLAEAPTETQVSATDRGPLPEAEPAGAPSTKLGVSVTPVPSDVAGQARLSADQRGLLVTEVTPLGPSWNKLGQRDIIVEVLSPVRRAIRTPADLQQVLSGIPEGQYISLRVLTIAQNQTASRVVNIRVGE